MVREVIIELAVALHFLFRILGIGAPDDIRQSRTLARKDFFGGPRNWRVWLALGLHDIKMRYKRTILGPVWISLSMMMTFVAIGLLYSALLKSDIRSFMPYLGAGMVLWGLASTAVGEASQVFLNSRHIITSLQLPLTIHVIRCVLRNSIVFSHNVVMFIVVSAVLGTTLSLNSLFLLISFPLFLLGLYLTCLIIAILGARFRDIGPAVGMLTQLFFFLTPIIWSPEHIPEGRKYWVTYNPIYHMIEIVRAPLLGEMPAAQSIIVSLLFVLVLTAVSYVLFINLRRRIAYWL
jgi:lipopolysaccharide transport system permease protein